ncbi:MAG: hypothetical protein JST84_32740 [Acidobacteria bacterium]|nr:hypothetical protein [Acidobacteriota bacterium]
MKRHSFCTVLIAILITALAFPLQFGVAQGPLPLVMPTNGKAEVLAAFNQLQRYIGALKDDLSTAQRATLDQKLNVARDAFNRGNWCETAELLESYLRETQSIRKGQQTAMAEDLHNHGWDLRRMILTKLPAGENCVGQQPVGKEPAITLAESDNRHLRAKVSFEEPRLRTVKAGGETWTYLEFTGLNTIDGRTGSPESVQPVMPLAATDSASYSTKPGLPIIPVYRRFIAVPQGAEVRVSQVRPHVVQQIRLNLLPGQPIVEDEDEDQVPSATLVPTTFVKDQETYSTNEFLPIQISRVHPTGQARGLSIAQIEIAPGQYNPATDTLSLFDSVEVEVTFSGGNGTFVARSSLNVQERITGAYIDRSINSSSIFDHVNEDQRALSIIGEELLILTHPNFRQAADALAHWKWDKGIVTSVFEIGAGTRLDTKEEIDRFIETRYDQCWIRPSYVLLLGDAEFIPTFYLRKYKPNGELISTDYPYAVHHTAAQVRRTPDLAQRLREDPYLDFAVGRIPVDTQEQAQTVVDKIISYESQPPNTASFYENVSIASNFECCEKAENNRDDREFIRYSEAWRNHLLEEGKTVQRIYSSDATGAGHTPTYFDDGTRLPMALQSPFPWDGSTAGVVDAINEGRFLMIYYAHGGTHGWGSPRFTTRPSGPDPIENDLANGNLLPVVFSISCQTGFFDNESRSSEFDDVLFSEALLRKENGGAIGVLAASVVTSGGNPHISKGFLDAVWPAVNPNKGECLPQRRLGDILNYGKWYMLERMGVDHDNAHNHLRSYNALGDPTLEMWTEQPTYLPSAFRATRGPQQVEVQYAIEGATITAFQDTVQGPLYLGKAVIRNGRASLGYIKLPIPLLPIQLSASKENCVSRMLTSRR